MAYLDAQVHRAQDLWASGLFITDDAHKTALMNAEAVGKVQAMMEILGLNYEGYLMMFDKGDE